MNSLFARALPHLIHRRCRHGVAAVEFAVVLPLLALVLFGIWEVGRILQTQQIVTTAAREGARQAAGGAYDNTQVQQIVLQYLDQAGVSTQNATVSIENLTDCTRSDGKLAVQFDQLRVTVGVPFGDIAWIPLAKVTPLNTVTATATWMSVKDKDFPEASDPAIE